MKGRYKHRAGLALGALLLGAAPQPAVADHPPPDPFEEPGFEPGEADDGPPAGEDDATQDVPPPSADDVAVPVDQVPDVTPPDDPPEADGPAAPGPAPVAAPSQPSAPAAPVA